MNAQEIIGTQEKNDWLIDPQKHADNLPDEAHSLKKILNSSSVQVLQKRYDRHNNKAITSQKTYLKQSKRRIYSAAGSIIIGAFILYFQGIEVTFKSELTWLFSIIELILLAITTFYSSILKNSKSYENWMDSRAQAETIRVKYFSLVAKHQTDDIDLNKLQLEYFRRYMLDVQLNYYDGRGKQHTTHAKKFITSTAILAALSVVITTVIAKMGDGDYANSTEIITLFVFIGAVIAALNTVQSQLAMLSEDQRNARRYESVYYQLLDLSGELDTVREAAEQGKQNVVDDFITRTNEVILRENQEWQTRRERKPKLKT